MLHRSGAPCQRRGVTKNETLRSFRETRGLRLDALALLAGVDVATVSRIERGIVSARPDTVVRLAQAFGVSSRRMQRMCDLARVARLQDSSS